MRGGDGHGHFRGHDINFPDRAAGRDLDDVHLHQGLKRLGIGHGFSLSCSMCHPPGVRCGQM